MTENINPSALNYMAIEPAETASTGSEFLRELAHVEAVEAEIKLPPIYFQEELDEVRAANVKRHKEALERLHDFDGESNRRDKYGRPFSSLWKQDSLGRIQITIKDGSNVIQLVPGKDAWLLPDVPSACRFLAAAIEAMERKELDRFMTVKAKKSKAKHYHAYLKELREHRRKALAERVIGDVGEMPLEAPGEPVLHVQMESSDV